MKCDKMKAYIGPNTTDHTITEYYRHILFKSEADKVIAHHKFKRCLAMAKWCHSMWILLRDEHETKRSVFYWRWWNIWLELANKFKEEK